MKSGYLTGVGFDLPVRMDDGAVAKQQALVDQLSAALERNKNAAANAAAAQRSFLQESTVRNLVPEIAQQENLNNQLRVLQDLMTSLGNDEAAGARLKQFGVSFEAITAAIRVASAQIHDFKSEFDRALQGGQIANAAITAFSPAAKADIARQQSLLSTANSNYTGDQRKVLGEQAYSNALKEANTALAEQARARALTASQGVQSAQLEIDLIGKSIGNRPSSEPTFRRVSSWSSKRRNTGLDSTRPSTPGLSRSTPSSAGARSLRRGHRSPAISNSAHKPHCCHPMMSRSRSNSRASIRMSLRPSGASRRRGSAPTRH
ncbi:hypothetical protein [Bradyrhizobium ottawaense]|uniref:hypothetical protein n=1 Tax=Bradyrhizobium ottawaense TaxID=931866 RepID=UPI00384F46B4